MPPSFCASHATPSILTTPSNRGTIYLGRERAHRPDWNFPIIKAHNTLQKVNSMKNAKKNVIVVPMDITGQIVQPTELNLDNIGDFLCQVSEADAKVGEGYHTAISFLIGKFGFMAVENFSGNSCKSEDAKKKHANALELDYPDFQRLYSVWNTVKSRRADCWREAKRQYKVIEDKKLTDSVVAVQDKSETQGALEVDLELAKAEYSTASANRKRAMLNLAKAKLDGEDTEELAEYVDIAKKEEECAKEELDHIAHELKSLRETEKLENALADLDSKLEALAKWCTVRKLEWKAAIKESLDRIVVPAKPAK